MAGDLNLPLGDTRTLTVNVSTDGSDDVNHPSHYNQGDVECLDAQKSALGDEGFQGYLAGCAMKYIWRYRHKGTPVKDIQKAIFYLERLKEEVE